MSDVHAIRLFKGLMPWIFCLYQQDSCKHLSLTDLVSPLYLNCHSYNIILLKLWNKYQNTSCSLLKIRQLWAQLKQCYSSPIFSQSQVHARLLEIWLLNAQSYWLREYQCVLLWSHRLSGSEGAGQSQYVYIGIYNINKSHHQKRHTEHKRNPQTPQNLAAFGSSCGVFFQNCRCKPVLGKWNAEKKGWQRCQLMV